MKESKVMKKIIHIFRVSKFVEDFVLTTLNYFSEDEHFFWTYGEEFTGPNSEIYLYKNVRWTKTYLWELKKPYIKEYLDSFDVIFIHGLFEYEIISFFYENKNLLKKLMIYFWGGDIPAIEDSEMQKKKQYVIAHVKGIISIIESDLKKISSIYHPVFGKTYTAVYCSSMYWDIRTKYLKPIIRENSKSIVIQVGNSGTETNCHIEILKQLLKYKDQNINIKIPLAYGDSEYIRKVEIVALEMFEGKVDIQKDYMSKIEYTKQLSNVDVAIFAMKRQQALGNIISLLMNGSKVYLNYEGQNKEFFDNLACLTYDSREIGKVDFEHFIDIKLEDSCKNHENIIRYFNQSKTIDNWKKIYADL